MEKYEEALERAREIYNAPVATIVTRTFLEQIFPELAESEDEKIRKELIEYLTHRAEVTGFIDEDKDCKRWIAYLEKQREQKTLSTEETELNSIAFLEQLGYTCVPPGAKQKPAEEITSNPDYTDKVVDKDKNILFKIATILSQYEDKDGSPLEQIRSLMVEHSISEMDLHREQQPAEWSEEDERMNEEIRQYLKQDRAEFPGRSARLNRMISWLISLRPQLKYEWSEEDEVNLGDIKCALYDYYGEERAEELYNMLKSLRPQPHWKPSEEQLKALESCFCEFGEGCPDEDGLRSLYNDLKKLM